MLIVDGHCDTATFLSEQEYAASYGKSQVDFDALRRYGVGIQFWAIWQDKMQAPCSFTRGLKILQNSARAAAATSGMGVLTKKSQLDLAAQGESLLFMGFEGVEQLEGDLDNLDIAQAAGCGFIGITWNHANEAAAGCLAAEDSGLTAWGRRLIKKMNEKHLLLDLAHASEKTFWQALEVTEKIPVVSHTCCDALYHHPRNLSDTQLRALAQAGGVAGITFVAPFLAEENAGLSQVVAHIRHGVEVAGIRHIGIGSDFDGTDPIPGLEKGTADLSNLCRALSDDGFSKEEIAAIMGGNFFRVLQENLV